MKIAVISSILGGIEHPKTHVAQKCEHEVEFICVTESQLPPRSVVNPRMQAKHPKMCGFKYTDADIIMWMDGSYQIVSEKFVGLMLKNLGEHDICIMPHPVRRSVLQELVYIEHLFQVNDRNIIRKCSGEPMRAQVESYLSDKSYHDRWLAECGCFMYRNNEKMRMAMLDWLSECIRWSVRDQLSFPYAMQKNGIAPVLMRTSRNEYRRHVVIHTH